MSAASGDLNMSLSPEDSCWEEYICELAGSLWTSPFNSDRHDCAYGQLFQIGRFLDSLPSDQQPKIDAMAFWNADATEYATQTSC